MRKVRWLLVGAGDISQKRVAPALASADGSELSAICDLRESEAVILAQEYGAQAFADFDIALATTDVDAVYLATPVALHVRQGIKALAAGKHVLIEKPLGLSSSECEILVQAAEHSSRYASCAYFRRFSPRYEHARSMIAGSEFGQVVSVRMTYFTWFDPSPDDPKYWRVIKAKSAGGPLSDMGSHMFDVLIGLFGMPVSVYANCANLVHQWDVEDSASLILTLSNGAQVTASFHWNSKTWKHEFEIVGTEAKLNWLPYDTEPVVKTVGRKVENLELPGAENVHLPLVQDFVSAILERRSPLYTVAESAKVNKLLDAVYHSAFEKREIKL